jgi:hypothetical protein
MLYVDDVLGGTVLTKCGYRGEDGRDNMCFCETNLPFFIHIFDITIYTGACCERMLRRISVGSFWKTNPPEGVFLGGNA